MARRDEPWKLTSYSVPTGSGRHRLPSEWSGWWRQASVCLPSRSPGNDSASAPTVSTSRSGWRRRARGRCRRRAASSSSCSSPSRPRSTCRCWKRPSRGLSCSRPFVSLFALLTPDLRGSWKHAPTEPGCRLESLRASLSLEGRGFSPDEQRFHDAFPTLLEGDRQPPDRRDGGGRQGPSLWRRGPHLLPGALARPPGRPRRQAGPSRTGGEMS
jgi:hypothetical protein